MNRTTLSQSKVPKPYIRPLDSDATAHVPKLLNKEINREKDMKSFMMSKAYTMIMRGIDTFANAVEVAESVPDKTSHGLTAILESIKERSLLYCPSPEELHSRSVPGLYGHPKYREFYDDIKNNIYDISVEHLGKIFSAEDLKYFAAYISISLGDRVRLDYGTGHELNFFCAILLLTEVKPFTIENRHYTAITIFKRYNDLICSLIKNYSLAPAGSKGCWGLDDYFHLSFIFGAAELINVRHVTPDAITDRSVVRDYKERFMFFSLIEYIYTTKRDYPLSEVAPMLYNMSAVATWRQITCGLIKMFAKEVLGKFPVVQHLYFCPLLPYLQTDQKDTSDTTSQASNTASQTSNTT